MKRTLVLAGVVFLLAGACAEEGGGPGNGDATAPAPSAPATSAPSPTALPAIVVDTPSTGDEVSSPVTISGEANVFEATVSIRILDASGEVIVEDFTTATCGTGCRGTYSTAVAFEVESQQPGTIEVFESSAEDGSQLNLVTILVTLAP